MPSTTLDKPRLASPATTLLEVVLTEACGASVATAPDRATRAHIAHTENPCGNEDLGARIERRGHERASGKPVEDF
eukprot:8769690-Pyramimonas_sp.AAC.1